MPSDASTSGDWPASLSPASFGLITDRPQVLCDLKAGNKAAVLVMLAEPLAKASGLDDSVVLDALMRREEVGSTGVGHGVALPHAWVPGCRTIAGAFARLARPIDWQAVDGEPVDLVLAVVGPEGEPSFCLSALALAARVLGRAAFAEQLRRSQDPASLFAALRSPF